MDNSKIIRDDIFDDYTDDTVIFIPVDGSFEYRIESTEFPEGIKENSLHGQFIKLLGAVKFKNNIDDFISQNTLSLSSPCEFPKACRKKNASLGTCITIQGSKAKYCLVVICWLDKDGKAFLSNNAHDEIKIFKSILDKITEHINNEFSKGKDIRLPMFGTGVLRSKIKNESLDQLREIQMNIYEKKLKNCTWRIYEK